MRADYFVAVFTPSQVAALTACVKTADSLSSQAIPKSNAAVCSSTSTCQKSVLVRRPCNRFYGSGVVGKGVDWLVVFRNIPNKKFVIVASRCQHATFIMRPLETTNFLLVSIQTHLIRLLRPRISDVNQPIPAPRRQIMLPRSGFLPRKRPNTSSVPFHASHSLLLRGIPQLDFALSGANGEMSTTLGPCNARDDIFSGGKIAQFGNSACGCGPKVDGGTESHGEEVLG
mmetsp:Transcript_20181/g.41996  ORF Transcript_20181/g.41996 Transcript_20181/m.41996 type:complete len:229 (-) Transcript_20181:1302-1988(-)